MSLDELLNLIPAYVLVLFRVAAMMLSAPLFGSARIPKRIRVLLAIVLAAGIAPGITIPSHLPRNEWTLAIGLGGEIVFGLAMGTAMSFTFFAAQWAGEMIGQQMGLNLSETFDPQFGHQGSPIGEIYFLMTLVIFLTIRGHHAMIRGVAESFHALPVLSVGMNAALLDTFVGLFTGCTILAIQLAAPILVSMLIVDLAMGFIGKTIPQINVMSAGLTMRSLAGMVIVIVGLVLTSDVLRQSLLDSMESVRNGWRTGLP